MELEPLNGPIVNWSGVSGSIMDQWKLADNGNFIIEGWTHVPIQRSSDNVRMFVNGVEIDPNAWVQLELDLGE